MSKEVVISNSTLNSYGFRVLTAGIELDQYRRNPILLWMHTRPYRGTTNEVLPLGRIENLRIDGDDLIGTPVFDGSDEFTRAIEAKWNADTLRAVSAGMEPIEWSEDKQYMLPGQQYATLTKSKLVEVSICDIGANDDALKLYNQGEMINLTCGADLPIPRISNQNDKKEMLKIALKLGLPDAATEQEILQRIDSVMADASNVVSLTNQVNTLTAELSVSRKAAIELVVDAAVGSKRITAAKRDHFIALGEKIGAEDLKSTLECMSPAVKPSSIIEQPSGSGGYKKLSDVPEAEIEKLRAEQRDEYVRLYKAEYGYEPDIKE